MPDANGEIKLTEWEESLMRAIQARQRGIQVVTLEEDRALFSIRRTALALAQRKLGRREVTRWSMSSSIRYPLVDGGEPQVLGDPKNPNHPPPEKRLRDWMSEKDDAGSPAEGILVFADIETILERNPGFVRLLRETLAEIMARSLRKHVVILNKDFRLPDELRSHFMRFALELPDVEHLVKLYADMLVESRAYPKFQNVRPPPEIVRAMACAVSGLTEVEARTLFALALAKFGDLDRRAVGLLQREKARVLLAGGALAMTEPKAGFAQVGGLEHAKTWAEGVTPLINDPGEARKFGLKIPSGLLLVGVSGTGKSLLAESLAHEWRLPLLRFDVGSCFGSLVGESERNVRRMIEMAQALRPCVVFVDEIEKGLGGDSLDGGTTSRVKATLLTWLQDKPDSIFVVATANDLTRLKSMPELIRAGRFDQTFFVDLPDCKTRAEIFVIHFGKAGHAVAPEWLQEAAQACPRYSGAEIEAIVQQALRFAFAAEPRGLTREMLMRSVRDVKPLADTMAESVSRLRAWCRDGRARLAGGALENEIVIEKKTNGQDSLSDLAAN